MGKVELGWKVLGLIDGRKVVGLNDGQAVLGFTEGQAVVGFTDGEMDDGRTVGLREGFEEEEIVGELLGCFVKTPKIFRN